jgi:hypothetical protein
MTVPSALVRANFTGDGTAGPKSFSFKIQDQDHLTVIVRDTTLATDNGTLLVRGATNGYTVAGVGAASGGTITLTGTYATSVTSDFKGIILHTPAKTQSLDTRNSTTFNSSKAGIEDSLDKLTGMALSLQDQLDRALVFGAAIDDAAPDAVVNGDLPIPAASEFMIRNATNDGWESLTLTAAGAILLNGTPADNVLFKADGTGGAMQPTSIVVDDSDNVSAIANLSITGNMTVTGTVDGRDVATDGTKLDGIEALADVTDTTNVTAAGALMDSEVTNLAQVKAFDAADYATAAQGTKVDFLTVTQAVDLDTMETDVAANTAKVTNATHTGDVTGSGTLTVDPTAISGKTLVTAVGADHVLILDATDGVLKKSLISDFASAGGDMAAATYDPATIAEQLVGLTATQTLTNKTLTAPVVNSPTGIDADDIDDAATVNKFATAAQIAKVDFLTVTQAVDLDTMESDITANTAKVTNATHTGDVTGATALTIDPTAISGKTLVTADGTDHVMVLDATDGALKKVLVSDFGNSDAGRFLDSFVNADLTTGVLTVNHALNNQYVSVTVIDDNDQIIIPDSVDFTDSNNLDIDLSSYGTLVGTWNAVILSHAGGGANTQVELGMAVSDETTELTTGTAKLTFRMPHAMSLTEVRASVGTAPTGAVLTVDINETGSTILSTKLTIDATEKTSTTAAAPAVISDTALADDAEITVDIDTVGSTIAGAGLKIWLIGTRV